jgi:hypothetical protein
MSATTTPKTPTDQAVDDARGFAQAVSFFQTDNPALAAQITGSLSTYAKSGAAPIVGAILGWAVPHYGLACSVPPTPGCWSPDLINQVSEVAGLVCASAASLVMHWLSKAPARAAIAASPPPAPPVATMKGPTP